MDDMIASGTILPYAEYPQVELPANHTKFKIQGFIVEMTHGSKGEFMLIVRKYNPEYFGPSNFLNLSYGDDGYIFNHGEADHGVKQMLYEFTHADKTNDSTTELTLANYQKLLEQFKEMDILKIADVNRKKFDSYGSYHRTHEFGRLEHFTLLHFIDSNTIRFADNISNCGINSIWDCKYDPDTGKVISICGDLRYSRIIVLLKLINEYSRYQVHCIGCNEKIDRWIYQEHFIECAPEKIAELTRTVEFNKGQIKRLAEMIPKDDNE
jgi:hypothetical protein